MEVGDQITVGSTRAGEKERTGTILEIRESDGHPHMRVRWSDDHESLFFPAAGTMIRVHGRQGEDQTVWVGH